MHLPLRRARNVLGHAFRSPGFRLFGWRFARDYLRFALRCARAWGHTGPGTLRMLGHRLDYFNQSNALFLVHEVFAGAEYAFSTQRPAPRVVDCGANVGMSVLFFKALYPAARILAFEPEPVTAARLRETVAWNGLSEVEVHAAAVAEAEGTVRLRSPPGEAGSLVSSIEPGWGGGAATEVPAVRLSTFLKEPVDFLKLDVEGAEYGVVRDLAASGAISRVQRAAIEYHPLPDAPDALAEMLDLLRGAGMEVRVRGNAGEPGMVHAWRPA